MIKPLCVHCGKFRQSAAWPGCVLCHRCRLTPEVRALYPSRSKYRNRGRGLGICSKGRPAQPTAAPPGSDEKIDVLEARAEEHVDLFHEQDQVDRRHYTRTRTRAEYLPQMFRLLIGQKYFDRENDE